MDRPLTDRELTMLIQSVEKDGMIMAPVHLKENVIMESQKRGIRIAQKKTKISVKVELLLYGLKLSAAVAGAIALLGVIDINQSIVSPGKYATESYKTLQENAKAGNDKADSIVKHLNQKSNVASNKLNEFSNQIIGGNKR